MELTVQPLSRTIASEPLKCTPFLCVLGHPLCRPLFLLLLTPVFVILLGSADGVAVTYCTQKPSSIHLSALGLRLVPALERSIVSYAGVTPIFQELS